MWISKITVKNFRKSTIDNEISVDFNSGLNLLVGENNVGKTCVIEALALVLSYGNPDRLVFLKEKDFNDPNQPLIITIEFSNLTDDQEAAFLQALTIEAEESSKVKIRFSFDIKNGKIINQILCGENFETTCPPELIRALAVTYLPALRDVNQEFNPGYRSRIGKILKARFGEAEKIQIEEIFSEANDEALAHNGDENPVKQLTKDTNDSIGKLSIEGTENSIELGFIAREFGGIISSVSMKTASGLEIGTNGLGYNNLIYIATILTELNLEQEKEPHTFSCLIIEEPEAHLHPQLQTLLLEFLQETYPNIQIILSSHSPTIVSSTGLDNLSVMSVSGDSVVSRTVSNEHINEKHKIFLEKFLDVTKSQLFFARNIIFVEGVTEAILLEAFWNLHFTEAGQKFSQQSIEIVNISGVSFEPYVGLVKGIFSESDVKCVVVTDDDRGTGRTCPEQQRFKDSNGIKDSAIIETIFDTAPISARASKLDNKVQEIIDEGFQNIFITKARKTLEVEFALANIDDKRMLEGLSDLEENALEGFTDTQAAIEFWKKITTSDLKTEVSTKILQKINSGGTLGIPAHFIDAFNFIKPPAEEPGDETNE